MAINDYTLAPFTLPVRLSDATAFQVRANDNLIRERFNAHQSDQVAHNQSGPLANRPATAPIGAVYYATDVGSAANYLYTSTGWVTIAAPATAISGSGTAGKITKWSSSLGLTDSLLTEAGSTVSMTGTFSATTLAGTLSTAAQPNVTSLGTLTSLTVAGAVALNGNTTIGDASSDTLSLNARLNTDILPSTANARDVGSSALPFRTGYFQTSLAVGFAGAVAAGINLDVVGNFGVRPSTSFSYPSGLADNLAARYYTIANSDPVFGWAFVRSSNDAFAPDMSFYKTRSTTGGRVAVTNGDGLGTILWQGSTDAGTGVNSIRAAVSLYAVVNGTVSSGNLPADLVVATNAAGNAYPTTAGTARWRWVSDGTYRPETNNTYDIGTTAVRVRSLYTVGVDASGNATIGGTLGVTGATTLGSFSGTMTSGSVPASLVTAGTFGAGAYTFPAAIAITTSATAQNFISNVTSLGTVGVSWQDTGVNRMIARLNSGVNWVLNARDGTGASIGDVLTVPLSAAGTIAWDTSRGHTIGLLNGQTISNAASFTGTVTVATTLTQNGATAALVQSATSSTVDIGSGSGSGASQIRVNSAAGQQAIYWIRSGTSSRWAIYKNGSETGSDAGASLTVTAYTDAGAAIDNPLVINRVSGGTITLGGTSARSVTMTGTMTQQGATASLAQSATSAQVNIGTGSGSAGSVLVIRSVAGQANYIDLQRGTTTRWRFGANTTAESGSNAGSNWFLQAFDDAGASIDTPVSVIRAADGGITFARRVALGNATDSNTSVLTIGSATRAFSTYAVTDGAAGTNRGFGIRTAGSLRWLMISNTTAETGSDAGTGFSISAYTDAGSFIDSPIQIARAAGGTMTLSRPVSMSSTLTVTSTLTQNGTTASLVQSSTTADVNIGGTAASGATTLRLRGPSGQNRGMTIQTNSSLRWFAFANSTAEGGSNAGSDFQLVAYDDSAVAIDTALQITRAAGGTIAFSAARPITGGALTLSGLLTANNGIEVRNGADAAGRLFTTASGGLVIRGVTGSSYDLTFRSAAGDDILRNPTGTRAIEIVGGSTTNALSVTTTGAITSTFRYDSSNRLDIAVSSAGVVSLTPVGASARVATQGQASVGGTFTAQYALGVFSTLTATGGFTRGLYVNPVMNAAANSDVLYGMQVQPSVSVGAFTGTTAYGIFVANVTGAATNYALRTSTGLVQFGDVVAVGGATASTTTALITPAGTTGVSSLRVPHGVAPSAPVNGDLWTTTTGLFARINGTTASFSGTNTGDQTITLTGDVTGSGTSSFAATIGANVVTFAKFQQIATDRLLGRDTAATGNVEELTVGGGIEFTGLGGIQTSAFTGDVTKTAGGTATTIANDAVTYAKLQNASAGNVVLTRAAATSGDYGETALSASQLLGRGSTGDIAAITLGTGLSMSGATLNVSAGDVSGPASSNDNRIARFDGTTGKLLQNSAVSIGDTGTISGLDRIYMGGSPSSDIYGVYARATLTPIAGSGLASIANFGGSLTSAANNDELIGISTSGTDSSVSNSGAYTGVSWQGLRIRVPSTITGTFDSFYGIYISAVSGATNNYAIYTNAGLVRFSGNTGIGTSPSTSTRLALNASTTSVSSLRIPHGSAPTTPVDGDMWTTTAGLYIRINGATVGPLT